MHMRNDFRVIDNVEVNSEGVVRIDGKVVEQHYNEPYKVVSIKGKTERVHRLVAKAFPEICGELKKYYCVHHRNRNQLDNRAENLICLSQSQHKKLHQDADGISKPVDVFTTDGKYVGLYSSQCEAAAKLGIDYRHLSETVRGLRSSVKGYVVCEKDSAPHFKYRDVKKYNVYLDDKKIGEYTRKELKDIFSINNRTLKRILNGKQDRARSDGKWYKIVA